jgi:Tol biopolymer transport system component
MRKESILVLIMILLLSAPISAQMFGKNKVNYAKLNWRVYQAPHFDIYYYPEEEAFLDDMVGWSENAYHYLSTRLNYELTDRASLIFFKTHGEFEQQHVVPIFLPEGVGGFAEPMANRVVIPLDDPPEEMFKLVVHELTHIFQFDVFYQNNFMNRMRANPPLWLLEGMAEHMADNLDSMDEMIVRDLVANDLIPPFEHLSPTNPIASYIVGQLFWDFINERFGEDKVRSFVWELRRSGTGFRGIKKAVKETFNLSMDDFYTEFRRHLRKKYLPLLVNKAEPLDYGKQITDPEFKAPILSPVISPSGELAAGISYYKDDVDILLFSTQDGKLFKDITPGFSGDYEYIIAGKMTVSSVGGRDISWSADGESIAFLGRTGNTRSLFIIDVSSGKVMTKIKLPLDQALSPALSPDGTRVLLSGSKEGIRDIYLIDLATGDTRNLTNDEFFDYSPIFSPDGKRVVYLSSVNGYLKLFTFSLENPEEKKQLTYGKFDDIEPMFTRDGKRIIYISNQYRIYNIHSYELDTGRIDQYTDLFGGAFSPCPVDEAGREVIYASYFKGSYRLYRMKLAEPVRSLMAVKEKEEEKVEVETFKPPTLTFALEEEKKGKQARRSFFIDGITAAGAVATNGTVITSTQISFSDMLGENRFLFTYSTYGSFYRNVGFAYFNQAQRLNYGFSVFDYKTFFYTGMGFGEQRPEDIILQSLAIEQTGGAFYGSYPFSKFRRLEFSASLVNRVYDVPLYMLADEPEIMERFEKYYVSGKYISFGLSLVGDTTLYKFFGPLAGKRYRLEVEHAPAFSSEFIGFTNLSIDFRNYSRLSSRTLIAFRFFGGMSFGDSPQIFYFGGTNTLRGYPYLSFSGNRAFFTNLEFRFPLVDEVLFPFGFSLRGIRGCLFLDIGGAWFDDEDFKPFDFSGGLPRLEDTVGSLGLGVYFYFGPFELHWDFARRTDLRSLEPGWKTSFWIGSKF